MLIHESTTRRQNQEPRFFLPGAGDLEGAELQGSPRENRQGSIRFASPPLARVRAESGAREGFLGDKTSDTMFEAFYKTAMSVRAASRPPGSEAGASTDRARLQRQNTPARPRSSLTATAPSLASTPPRSARACTSPSSSPARSSAKRYATPPPVPDRTFPPRGRAAVVSHGTAWRERSIIEKKVAARRLRASRRSFR